VNITGQNTSFGQGTSTTNVWFEQGSTTIIFPNYSSPVNSTDMVAEFTFCYSNLGLYDLVAYNSLDGYMTLPNSFTLNAGPNPPELVMVDPDSAYRGEVLSVSITGQNTDFIQGTVTTVWLSQGTSTILRDSVNVATSSDLVASFTIPTNAPYGLWDVNVLDGGCNTAVTLTDGFTIYDTLVGIQSLQPEYNVRIFPNPSSGKINLHTTIPSWQTGEFLLYNIAGVEVGRYPLLGGTHQSTISLNLKDGLYIQQTRINGEIVATEKLVISNSEN